MLLIELIPLALVLINAQKQYLDWSFIVVFSAIYVFAIEIVKLLIKKHSKCKKDEF